MRIKPSSAFVALTPLFAFRVSDDFSLGLIDFVAIPAAIVLLSNGSFLARPAARWAIAFASLALLSGGIGFAVHGFELRDLAVLRIAFIFLPMLYALSLEPDIERLRRLTVIFVYSGALAVAVGIALHHLGIQLRSEQQMLWTGSGAGPSLRAGGLLGNSSDFGHFASTWGAITGLLVLALIPNRRWIWFVAIALLAFYGTWISASRSGLLHLIMAYAIAVPFVLRRSIVASLALMTPMLFAAGLLWFGDFDIGSTNSDLVFTLRRLDFLNLSGNSLFYQSERTANWIKLWDIWLENWFWGTGYKQIFRQYLIRGDNAFLTVLVEMGILSAVAYTCTWIALLVAALKRTFVEQLGGILFSLVVAEIVHALTLDTMTLWYSMPITLFFFALILRAVPPRRSWGTRLKTAKGDVSAAQSVDCR